MRKDALEIFLFVFSTIVFLYSFFQIRCTEHFGQTQCTYPTALIITPIVAIAAFIKLIFYEEVTRFQKINKRQRIKQLWFKLLDKFYMNK